jgi:hypothetical protein
MEIDQLSFQTDTKDNLRFQVFDDYQKLIFEYRYEPAYRLAIDTWYGFIEAQIIICIYEYIAKFAFENKQLIAGSITDLTDIEGSFDGISEWLTNDYMPTAVKYGFRFAAVVRSKDFFANLALEDLGEFKVGYTHKDFDKFEESYVWITAQLSKL